jgi:hypothetical protein
MRLKNGLTPLQTARMLMLQAIENAACFIDEKVSVEITPAQCDAVSAQIMKEYNRMARRWPDLNADEKYKL